MSTHKMNETGFAVVLDGIDSFFIEKTTGKSTPIKYEHGRYDFDIWAPAINKSSIASKSSDDVDCGHLGKNNKCWVLGADDEDEGF